MTLSLWYKVCGKLNSAFESFYYKLGFLIASRPGLTIVLSVLTCLLFSVGFIRFHDLNRVEKLYIPQHSQAMKDLDRGSKYFQLKARREEFILMYRDGRSAITEDLFIEALKVHNYIVNVTGYNEVCMKDKDDECVTLSPLEIFEFDAETIRRDGVFTVSDLFMSDSVFKNGKTARMLYHEFFGKLKEDDMTGMVEGESLRIQYFLEYPENVSAYNKAEEWEQRYLVLMEKWREFYRTKGIKLLYAAGRSANDDVLKSAEGDIKLAVVSFILMIIFCSITLAKFRDVVTGHLLLGLGGVLTIILGIGGAFGFVLLIGYPFIAFSGVLPFLIIGVGIDNMFIIIDRVDRIDPSIRGPERIAKAMSHVGASITMTTLTDLVAFSVSTMTDFPAIKYFSVYVACSITVCYLLVLTFFLALLAYDVKRIEQERVDFLPCMVLPRKPENTKHGVEESVSTKIMQLYGKALMKGPVKFFVILTAIAVLAVSVFAAMKTDQSFDSYSVGLENSVFARLSRYRDEAFPTSMEINVILDTPVDYTTSFVQREFSEIGSFAEENKFVKNESISWLTYFIFWAEGYGKSTLGKDFYPNLHEFLKEHKQFKSDIKFHPNGTIAASRMIMFGGESIDSLFRRDEMVSLRNELKDKTELPVYAITQSFIFTEQFVIVLRDTIRNLSISSGAILIITLPYLMHPVIGFLVLLSFVSLIFELLAIMYVWGVTLNSLSMIIIVMAIGFAVDYSAHIAHSFMVSKEKSAEKRVIDSLETIGTSVLMGGTSTFIGILVTGFATSGIFRIFFKMVFGIVVLGLMHGLVFLPVLLAVFCPGLERPPSIDSEDNGEKVVKLTKFNVNAAAEIEECETTEGDESRNVEKYGKNSEYNESEKPGESENTKSQEQMCDQFEKDEEKPFSAQERDVEAAH